MADKEDSKKPEAEASPAAPAKKGGLPIKMIGIVGAIMLAEAVGVFLFVSSTSKAPQPAEAKAVEGHEKEDLEATIEIPLLDEKFQNMQTGRVWIWDTSIVLKVRARNQEAVEKTLESRKAEIQEGLAMIFRRAPHSQLKEAGLETINRQITGYVHQILGKDGEGRDRVERVVIPRCKGFPTD
jgi:flagellar basal body-associated protein FliL